MVISLAMRWTVFYSNPVSISQELWLNKILADCFFAHGSACTCFFRVCRLRTPPRGFTGSSPPPRLLLDNDVRRISRQGSPPRGFPYEEVRWRQHSPERYPLSTSYPPVYSPPLPPRGYRRHTPSPPPLSAPDRDYYERLRREFR